jgi:hypothetical protein
MSNKIIIKCLIAFILGWLISRHMENRKVGNGFSVGVKCVYDKTSGPIAGDALKTANTNCAVYDDNKPSCVDRVNGCMWEAPPPVKCVYDKTLGPITGDALKTANRECAVNDKPDSCTKSAQGCTWESIKYEVSAMQNGWVKVKANDTGDIRYWNKEEAGHGQGPRAAVLDIPNTFHELDVTQLPNCWGKPCEAIEAMGIPILHVDTTFAPPKCNKAKGCGNGTLNTPYSNLSDAIKDIDSSPQPGCINVKSGQTPPVKHFADTSQMAALVGKYKPHGACESLESLARAQSVSTDEVNKLTNKQCGIERDKTGKDLCKIVKMGTKTSANNCAKAGSTPGVCKYTPKSSTTQDTCESNAAMVNLIKYGVVLSFPDDGSYCGFARPDADTSPRSSNIYKNMPDKDIPIKQDLIKKFATNCPKSWACCKNDLKCLNKLINNFATFMGDKSGIGEGANMMDCVASDGNTDVCIDQATRQDALDMNIPVRPEDTQDGLKDRIKLARKNTFAQKNKAHYRDATGLDSSTATQDLKAAGGDLDKAVTNYIRRQPCKKMKEIFVTTCQASDADSTDWAKDPDTEMVEDIRDYVLLNKCKISANKNGKPQNSALCSKAIVHFYEKCHDDEASKSIQSWQNNTYKQIYDECKPEYTHSNPPVPIDRCRPKSYVDDVALKLECNTVTAGLTTAGRLRDKKSCENITAPKNSGCKDNTAPCNICEWKPSNCRPKSSVNDQKSVDKCYSHNSSPSSCTNAKAKLPSAGVPSLICDWKGK